MPSSSKGEPERHRLSMEAVREAERHVECCASCRTKVGKYRQLVEGASDRPLMEPAFRGAACVVGQDVDWDEVAAGLWPEVKANQLIMHAALCDQCGPLLRAAASLANDEATAEEARLLAELKAPSRPTRNSKPEPIAPSPVSSLTWRRFLQWKIFVPVMAMLVLVGIFANRAPSTTPLSGLKFAEFAVSAHRQHAQGELALDVRSDSPQALNDWFRSKSQFSLALPVSPGGPGEERPYRLEGARLMRVRGTSAAYVAYRMQSGLVSLMVAPASVAVASGGVEVHFAKVNFHYATVDGYKAVTWSVHGLTYALISQEGNRTQASCMVCHSGMKDRDLTGTPTPLPVEQSLLQPVWQ